MNSLHNEMGIQPSAQRASAYRTIHKNDEIASGEEHFNQPEIAGAVRSKPRPTPEQIRAYQTMYDHFNGTLFKGALPDVILNFSRRARSRGFFAPRRWCKYENASITHEISLNPDLRDRDPREVASTLVHEMLHLWQMEYGSPSRAGYHNSEWADKMESIGLMPSRTGEPGGKRVGQSMTHFIIEGGLFAQVYQRLPESAR